MRSNTIYTGNAYHDHREFWNVRISATEPFVLPGNKFRTATGGLGLYTFHVDEESAKHVLAYSAKKDFETFILTLSAWHILFSRYASAPSVITRTPRFGNVEASDSEQKTVPIISDIPCSESLRSFLRAFNQQVVEAYRYQDFPIDADAANTNVFYSFTSVFEEANVLGLKHDMTIVGSLESGKITFEINYARDVFDEWFIANMAANYCAILAQYGELDQRVMDMRYIGERERSKILEQFNETSAIFPTEKTVVDLFLEHVGTNPQRCAVVLDSDKLSYAELDERSGKLAGILRKRYSLQGRGACVTGVILDKSIDSIVSLLAIWKSGGVYLPIDPEYPAERIRTIIGEAGASVLITHSDYFYSVADMNLNIVAIDIEVDLALPDDEGDHRPRPTDMAYVIFTSGSTGKPKGVAIAHRAMVNLAFDHIREFNLTGDDKILQFFSLCFDASVLDILMALVSGGTLVLVSKNTVSNAKSFTDYVEQHQVSLMTVTPSFLATLNKAKLEPARILITGGEPANISDARYYSGFKKYYNAYGPSEAAVNTTLHRMDAARDYHTVPIGRPRSNKKVFILDSTRQIVPVGVAAEMFIGGEGVAMGYLNDPGLTSEKFISATIFENETLYKTGDVARWNDRGEIEFIGRVDSQVKIRGFRVELGDIENAIAKFAGIRAVFILYQKDDSGDASLVAYVVAETDLDIQSLKLFVAGQLPYYMIPDQFLIVGELPMTPNGKVDTQALPVSASRRASVNGFVAPATGTEKTLADLWRSILHKEEIYANESFYDAGGNSLKLVQLLSHIYKTFTCNIELSHVSPNPTIQEFASIVERSQGGQFVAITPIPDADNYDLSFGQKRLYVVQQAEAGFIAYNVQSAFMIEGNFVDEAIEYAFRRVIARHEILRTTFHEIGGIPKQKVHAAEKFSFRMVRHDFSQKTDELDNVRKVAAKVVSEVFDLAAGPLVKVDYVALSRNRHALIITMHHIVGDGWSMEILTRELMFFYQSFHEGKQAELPPLRIQYRDFAAWQNALLMTSTDEHRLFWRKMYEDAVPALEWQTDFPRPDRKTFTAQRIAWGVSKEVSAALHTMARAENVSVYHVLLSAMYLFFSQIASRNDLVIGSPAAGRMHVDTEDQIGLYMNTLALRARLSDGMLFETFLQGVRDTCMEAMQYQAYPFDMLLNDLSSRFNLQGKSLFDIGFTWQNMDEENGFHKSTASLKNTTVSLLHAEHAQVKTDVWIHGWEEDHCFRFTFTYNSDLFNGITSSLLTEGLCFLLARISEKRKETLKDIKSSVEKFLAEKRKMTMNKSRENDLNKFLQVKKKAIETNTTNVVQKTFLEGAPGYPIVLRPAIEGLLLENWISENREEVMKLLAASGALLFRGFEAPQMQAFQNFVKAFSPDSIDYVDQSSPRSVVAEKLYTSTDHPADQTINMHNELSYSHAWPLNIMFYCEVPAQEGGETPIADSRQVLQTLSASVRERFAEKGILYVRNLMPGIGLSWQQVYQTSDRHVVEARCKENGIDYRWIGDDHLRISWHRPAIRKHPRTGEEVWFNHGFFFNAINLHHDLSEIMGGEDSLPFNTYYGDGSPIPNIVLEEIQNAYLSNQKTFVWQKGDILLLDNMLMAHSRNPFKGSRKILVAMSDSQRDSL